MAQIHLENTQLFSNNNCSGNWDSDMLRRAEQEFQQEIQMRWQTSLAESNGMVKPSRIPVHYNAIEI